MVIQTFKTVSGPQALVRELLSESVSETEPFEEMLDCTHFPALAELTDIEVAVVIENYSGPGDITVTQTGVENPDGSGLEEPTPVAETFDANTAYTALTSIAQMKKWPYVQLDIEAAAGVTGDIKLYLVGKNF